MLQLLYRNSATTATYQRPQALWARLNQVMFMSTCKKNGQCIKRDGCCMIIEKARASRGVGGTSHGVAHHSPEFAQISVPFFSLCLIVMFRGEITYESMFDSTQDSPY